MSIVKSFSFLSVHSLVIVIFSVAFYMKNTESVFTTVNIFKIVVLSSLIMGALTTLQARDSQILLSVLTKSERVTFCTFYTIVKFLQFDYSLFQLEFI